MTRRTTKNEKKLIDFITSTKRYTDNKLIILEELIDNILVDWHHRGNPLLSCFCECDRKYGTVRIKFIIYCDGYSFRQNKESIIDVTKRLIDCKDKESIIDFIDSIKSLTKYIISDNCIKEEEEEVYLFSDLPSFQEWLSFYQSSLISLSEVYLSSHGYSITWDAN